MCERTVCNVCLISKMNSLAYFLNTALQDETSHHDILCISLLKTVSFEFIFYSVLRLGLKTIPNEWKTYFHISTCWLFNSIMGRVIEKSWVFFPPREASPYLFSLVLDNFLRFQWKWVNISVIGDIWHLVLQERRE